MSQASQAEVARAATTVIIPAYKPAGCLIEVVQKLTYHFESIVVVDDGSGPNFLPAFDALSAIPGVHLLRHPSNQGKGAALKTGIAFALSRFPHIAGVVTADADGQHCPFDIVRVRDRFLEDPERLVLGARAFDVDVPWRSRLGNSITRCAMRVLVGDNLADTQTGMRAIPRAFAAELLKIPAKRYEFELDMLLAARREQVGIAEERIQTLYEKGNPSSHFNPLLDSMRIYLVLLRFCSASLLAALIDNLIFYAAIRNGSSLWLAQLAGRAGSVAFNYLAVKSAVFYAQDRHAVAFPKYLALVACSGTIAYFGIQTLTEASAVPVLWAKILIESLLFFANFAVQRLWVFPKDKRAASVPGRPSPLYRLLLWSSILIASAVLVYGLYSMRLLEAPTWSPVGMRRFFRFAAVFGAVALGFFFAGRRLLPVALATVVTACTLHAAGPAATFSLALFLTSAAVLGRRIFTSSWVVSLLAGLAIWSFAVTVTARFQVHYAPIYAALAILALLICRSQTRELWSYLRRNAAHASLKQPSTYWAFSLLAFVMVAHWMVALKPEVSADGLAMHLAIAADIATNHALTIHHERFIWALMPMGADFCYAIAYTLGGEFAARLLNFAMLGCIVALVYRSCRHWITRPVAILVASLFASAPLVQLVTGAMLVENLVAAILLATAVAFWGFLHKPTLSSLLLCALLAGSAVGWKLGAFAVVVVILPLLIWAAFRSYRQLGPHPGLASLAAAVIFLAPAVFPYAYAYMETGNPVFPFKSDRFPSPYLQEDLYDGRFQEPLSLWTPARLTLETSRYYEGQDGSFGFQYLLFLPLCLVTAPLLRSRREYSPLLIGLAASFIIAAAQPNARYFYVALPFLSIAIAVAVARLRSLDGSLYHASIAAMVAALGINLWFLPTSNWYHRDFVSRPVFSAKGAHEYRKWNAPVRDVVDYVNRAGGAVAFTATSEIAGVQAPVYSSHWHGYAFRKQVEACRRPSDVHRLLKNLNIQHLVAPTHPGSTPVDPVTPAMSQFLSLCTASEFQQGSYHSLRIIPDCEARLADVN